MNITGKTLLVTGANRGVGEALVKEALKRGAQRVFAGTRGTILNPDPRVTALTLDVTNASQIQRAADQVAGLDVLINNAGLAIYENLTDVGVIQKQLDVNLLGPLKVAQAFLPLLIRSKGAIVNVLSVVAVAPYPPLPGYSISKAAALSLTQSLRALLARQGVGVHAVILGGVNTDMSRGFDGPRSRQSPLRQGSSMASRTGRRISFLIRHRRRLRTAGAPELPKHSSAGSTP